MNISLRARYKDVQIDLSGNENEDLVQKLADIVVRLKDKGEEALSSVEAAEPPAGDDRFNNMMLDLQYKFCRIADLDNDGPRVHQDIIRLLSGSRSIKLMQTDSFVLIAYLLKMYYGVDNPSVKRVTRMMKESGIDCSNLQNLTPYLTKRMQYISKPIGSQYFTLTPKGGHRAKVILDILDSFLSPANSP
jgi:hypothetical protein